MSFCYLKYNNFMASNFDFLQKIDKKLFSVIDDAEKLYRDGYFEQTIAQTRKFAEIICKNTLGVRRTTEETFDDMLGTLKDISGDSVVEKEFIDDMYFLKKQGNLAVHGSVVEQGGNVALECLQRAFELSINYAIKNNKANKKIINSHYSIDLLMTGKKYKFSEKYQKVREEENEQLKEEVKDLALVAKGEKPKKETKKVQHVDFKNKKKIKVEKSTKIKKQTKKVEKPKKEIKKFNKENMKYILAGSFLFVLMISILIFILPI